MDFTLETFKTLWGIALTIGMLAIGMVTYWARQEFARRQDLDAAVSAIEKMAKRDDLNSASQSVRTNVADVATRLTKVETTLEHMPTTRAFDAFKHEITSDLSSLSTSVGELSGQLRGMTRALDLMNEHLLNRERK